MPHGMEVVLSPGDFGLDGEPAPSQKGGGNRRQSPSQFSAHDYCCRTAGWIKMALGTQVGLGPGHIVQDGDPPPLPPKRGQSPLIFSPFLLWPNGWMDQDGTWHGGGPWSSPHCGRWDPAPSPKRNFRPMSIVAKRLDGSRCHLVRKQASIGLRNNVLDRNPALPP